MGNWRRLWTWLWLAEDRRDHCGQIISRRFGPLGWLKVKIYRPLKRHWFAHWKHWTIVLLNAAGLAVAIWAANRP